MTPDVIVGAICAVLIGLMMWHVRRMDDPNARPRRRRDRGDR
jgi:hypothetical protein